MRSPANTWPGWGWAAGKIAAVQQLQIPATLSNKEKKKKEQTTTGMKRKERVRLSCLGQQRIPRHPRRRWRRSSFILQARRARSRPSIFPLFAATRDFLLICSCVAALKSQTPRPEFAARQRSRSPPTSFLKISSLHFLLSRSCAHLQRSLVPSRLVSPSLIIASTPA